MPKYHIHCKPDEMEEICDLSPYNLKKDIEKISEDELNRIAVEIAHELQEGLGRKPTPVLHWDKLRKASCVKVKISDVLNDAGKSSGYRCVTLVDTLNCHAFLLHIYKHGRPKDDNIDRKTQKKLNALVDEYASSL